MSFADELRNVQVIDCEKSEKDRIEKEKKDALSRFEEQIRESLLNLKKRGEIKENVLQGFFYSEYWWDICHFKPYTKDDLITESLKKDSAEYYISAFLIKAQKIFSKEVNIFEPLTSDDIKTMLEDLGFKDVRYEVVSVKYYRKCRLAETIFREYVKDEANVYYFTFEY